MRWSPNLQIWKCIGIQTFRFGNALESKPSDLEMRWNPNLQIWKCIGVQTFRFGNALESKPSDLEMHWSPNLQIWRLLIANLISGMTSDTFFQRGTELSQDKPAIPQILRILGYEIKIIVGRMT